MWWRIERRWTLVRKKQWARKKSRNVWQRRKCARQKAVPYLERFSSPASPRPLLQFFGNCCTAEKSPVHDWRKKNMYASPFCQLVFIFQIYRHIKNMYKCWVFRTPVKDFIHVLFPYTVCEMVNSSLRLFADIASDSAQGEAATVTFPRINISSRSTGRQFFFPLSLYLFPIFTNKGEQPFNEWVLRLLVTLGDPEHLPASHRNNS